MSVLQNSLEIKILREGNNPFKPSYINLLSPWENPFNSRMFNHDLRERLFEDIKRFSEERNDTNSEYRFLVGERGEGKTHILCNIRDRLIESDKSIFIYVEPKTIESYNDETSRDHIYLHILHQIEISLLRKLGGKQGKKLAASILNNFFSSYISRKCGIELPIIKANKISSYRREVQRHDKILKKNNIKKGLDSLFDQVKNDYIGNSESNVDHETINYIFKYALYNHDKSNIVYLSKWLKGIKIGRKSIHNSHKALDVLRTINDIIRNSGRHLVVIFDQFERTIGEAQVIDELNSNFPTTKAGEQVNINLKTDQDNYKKNQQQDLKIKLAYENHLVKSLHYLFNNLWKLLENCKKTFLIMSLRKEHWDLFNRYLVKINSNLGTRFSSNYLVELEKLNFEKSLSIIQIFLENIIKEVDPSINSSDLVTKYFPFYRDDNEKEKKEKDYILKTELDVWEKTSSFDLYGMTLYDFFDLSKSAGKYIIRDMLEWCDKGFLQIQNAVRDADREPGSTYPKRENQKGSREIKLELDYHLRSNYQAQRPKDIKERLKIYLSSLIQDTSFQFIEVASVNILKTPDTGEFNHRILYKDVPFVAYFLPEYDPERYDDLLSPNLDEEEIGQETVFKRDDRRLNDKIRIEITIPKDATVKQAKNCLQVLNENNWNLDNDEILIPRFPKNPVKKIKFEGGSVFMDKISSFADQLAKRFDWIYHFRFQGSANGKNIYRVKKIDFKKREIHISLPHNFSKDSLCPNLYIGLHPKSSETQLNLALNKMKDYFKNF